MHTYKKNIVIIALLGVVIAITILYIRVKWFAPPIRGTWIWHNNVVIMNVTTVKVVAPCATLTPFVDYRDFMQPGRLVMGGDYAIRGHPMPGYADQAIPPGVTLIPPEKATIIFADSTNCGN